MIDKKYTVDGEVTIRIEVATYPILSAQVGFDDILVQGAILPNDQAYTPDECPVCSNTERHHYIGGPIDSYSGNYSYAQTDIGIATLDVLGNRIQAVEHLVKPTTPTTNTTPIIDTYIIYLPLVLKGGLPPGQIIDYDYDNLNRLTSASYSTGETYAYTYDPTGNRLQQTINGDTTTYQYDEANRLTKVNNVSYTWDDNGNLLNDSIRTFSYNAENRLTQIVSGSLSTQFAYNGFGDRTRKWVNSVETQYLLDPLGLTHVLAETTNGQRQFYMAGLAQYDGTQWAYQLPDPLGSVRQLVNVQGQVKLTQSYDPFGNLVEQIGSVQSGFGYTGQQHDPSAGLVYLRARYYDPATGRFISKDPFSGFPTLPQTHNPYPYVINNPINYTDPTGEYFESPLDVAFITTGKQPIGAKRKIMPVRWVLIPPL